jgi:hypothetical protein
VSTFFKASGRHDGEVDGTAQIDEIRVGRIFDLDLLVRLLFLIVAATDI